MRNFKTSFDNETVDLDDTKTYEFLPQNTKDLDDMMFCEIGKALTYMDYFHPDIFPKHKKRNLHEIELCGWQQRQRVYKLIKNFADNRRDHYDDVLRNQEQVFLFIDETENMC